MGSVALLLLLLPAGCESRVPALGERSQAGAVLNGAVLNGGVLNGAVLNGGVLDHAPPTGAIFNGALVGASSAVGCCTGKCANGQPLQIQP